MRWSSFSTAGFRPASPLDEVVRSLERFVSVVGIDRMLVRIIGAHGVLVQDEASSGVKPLRVVTRFAE